MLRESIIGNIIHRLKYFSRFFSSTNIRNLALRWWCIWCQITVSLLHTREQRQMSLFKILSKLTHSPTNPTTATTTTTTLMIIGVKERILLVKQQSLAHYCDIIMLRKIVVLFTLKSLALIMYLRCLLVSFVHYFLYICASLARWDAIKHFSFPHDSVCCTFYYYFFFRALYNSKNNSSNAR